MIYLNFSAFKFLKNKNKQNKQRIEKKPWVEKSLSTLFTSVRRVFLFFAYMQFLFSLKFCTHFDRLQVKCTGKTWNNGFLFLVMGVKGLVVKFYGENVLNFKCFSQKVL